MGGGGESSVENLGSPGALWAGFAFMTFFTFLFMRASYHIRSKTSRVYHYITTLITGLAAFAYLVLALNIGGVYVRFIDWFLTTPLLLADLAFLAAMPAPEVAYLAVVDMCMVTGGLLAEVTETPAQIWPMFAFSTIMFLVIVVSLVTHLRAMIKAHTGTVEAKAFRFLAVWTMVLWTVYPLLFVLTKVKVLNHGTADVIHTVLDILAKGIFGVIIIGSREALEGETTGEALLAMLFIGIDPTARRASMTAAHIPAVDLISGSAQGSEASMGAHSASMSVTSTMGGVPVKGKVASHPSAMNAFGPPAGRNATNGQQPSQQQYQGASNNARTGAARFAGPPCAQQQQRMQGSNIAAYADFTRGVTADLEAGDDQGSEYSTEDSQQATPPTTTAHNVYVQVHSPVINGAEASPAPLLGGAVPVGADMGADALLAAILRAAAREPSLLRALGASTAAGALPVAAPVEQHPPAPVAPAPTDARGAVSPPRAGRGNRDATPAQDNTGIATTGARSQSRRRASLSSPPGASVTA